jgi:hypothetical protein
MSDEKIGFTHDDTLNLQRVKVVIDTTEDNDSRIYSKEHCSKPADDFQDIYAMYSSLMVDLSFHQRPLAVKLVFVYEKGETCVAEWANKAMIDFLFRSK